MNNNLQVFKDSAFGEIRTGVVMDEKGVRFLFAGDIKIDRFSMLALASKFAYEDDEYAWEILNLASKLFHHQNDFVFNELYRAVAMEITRVNLKGESDLYPVFNRNANKVLGVNAKVIKRRNNPKHQPDSWIRINGEDIPVEIKLNKFDNRALSQLKRYMNFYECSKGIAVANELTVKLPQNIQFISLERLGVE
ncbi:MAG: hypothetical protein GX996_03610 [Firmicutes bacterium]|nr:hypothetical protein [Bacillota bacterium]